TSDPIARRDGWVMVGASALLFLLALDEEISRADGLMMLAALAIYTWHILKTSQAEGSSRESEEEVQKIKIMNCSWCAAAYICIGLAMLMTGADILVDGAITMARRLHVSEAVIALTVVAAGTSVPELITSVLAARRGRQDLNVSSIIASNIFNILGT